jgi:3-(3-hydroxy-phenyl)propionate hydroxylase
MDTNSAVIVIGAGPVGALSAYLLARRGISVTLLEREAERVIDYRASTFHPPTLDLLEECGATAALLAMGLKAPVMQYRDRTLGKVAEIDFSVLANDTRYPFRLQCEQFKLTQWLYEQLDRITGAGVRFRHEVADLRQSEDGVEVAVNTPSGPRLFRARYAIAADGGRSTVRRKVDIAFDGYTHPEQFLVAGTRHDFRAAMPDICSVNYTADPDEWFLLLEIPDMWRIVFPVAANVEAEDAIADKYLEACLQNIAPRAEPYELLVKAIYRVHQRVAAGYRADRVFLAGDAAHLNNPLGGMGLNGGIHDALALTERLAAVIDGGEDDRALDGYEAQRRPAAIGAINAMTERNKKLLEERDPAVRRRNIDHWRKIASDRALMHAHALETSMIASLRATGMLPVREAKVK